MGSAWSRDELDQRIAAGDVAGALRLVRRCDAAQRAEIIKADPWSRVRDLPTELRNTSDLCDQNGESPEDLRLEAARLVAESASIHEELDQRGLHPDTVDIAVIEKCIEDTLNGVGWIHSILTLLLTGEYEPPDSEAYRLAVMRIPHHRSAPRTILRLLPRFMDRDLWKLFELEGGGDTSLAALDKYTNPSNTWSAIFITFAEAGEAPRSRLLDASLDALDRDFAQFRAGWFSRFHEALVPTVDERSARGDRYLHLVGSSIPPTASFALKALAKLDRAKRSVPAGSLLEEISPALSARAKGPALTALRLVAGAAKRESSLRQQAALVAVTGLMHADADVQSKTLDLLFAMEAMADPEVRGAVLAAKGTVVPVLQRRVADLLGEDIVDRKAQRGPLDASTPQAESDSALGASAQSPNPVAPIRSFEELVERCAYVLENAEDSIEVERVIGGLARLGTDRPRDWEDRIGPLLKRVSVLSQREVEDPDPILDSLIELFSCWHSGRVLNRSYADPYRWRGPSTIDLFRERLVPLTRRLSKRMSVPLLSEITHDRGWIDPRALVNRALALQEARTKSTDLADELLSVLRLSVDGRREALASASGIKGEFGHVLRYALGSDEVEVGHTAALWIAAARARDPLGDHPMITQFHPKIGVGGPRRSQSKFRVRTWGDEYVWHRLEVVHDDPPPKKVAWSQPTVMFHSGRDHAAYQCYVGGCCGFSEASVRWSATIAPGCTEDYFEVAAIRLDVEWSSVQWEVRCFFEPLLQSDVTLGSNAFQLIALGLGAKESGQSGMAIDACISAIDDGRMDAAELGRRMAELFPTGMIKIGRWAKALAEVARVSPDHALAVRTTIQATLRGDPADPPKNLGKLLDVWLQSAVDAKQGVTDPEAREYLEGLTVGGKVRSGRDRLLKL